MKVEDIVSGGTTRAKTRNVRSQRKTSAGFTKLKEHGMEGVGSIHVSEIAPTLARLEKDLGVDLQNNVLGSVGKKEFSGDIDVAMMIPDDEIAEFIKKVSTSGIVELARRGPLVVISRVKIQNYDPTLVTDNTRTGYVQVDFMIDQDPAWLKTFYHSPTETESNYKGAHRNIVLGALTKHVDPISSKEKTIDGRPLEIERFMFSSKKGLVRVIRKPVPKKNGDGHTKAWTNKVIAGPWKTGDEIAAKLNLGTAADLNSFETVFAAIKQNLGTKIASKVANDLSNDKWIQNAGLPDEAKEYL
jgi:hypothetical protein